MAPRRCRNSGCTLAPICAIPVGGPRHCARRPDASTPLRVTGAAWGRMERAAGGWDATDGKGRAMQFGRYYEEFEVGATYLHWPGKTLTEYDDHGFCLLTRNHHPLHMDINYAEKTSDFKRNVVVGNYIYSLLLGMSVPDISGKALANLEVESLRHVAPTFHGDTIYGQTTVLDKTESKSKDDRGVVYVETKGCNQNGRLVCVFRRKVMVPKRSYGDTRGDVVSDLVRHVARSGAADRAEQSADVDLQAGFLAHLAGHGLLDRLAGLQPAAGHGPQTLAGRAAAAYQQQPAGAVKHDRTRARHHWSSWPAADLTRLWSTRNTRAGRRVPRVDGWRRHVVSLTGCGGRAGTRGGAIGQGRWSLALRGGR